MQTHTKIEKRWEVDWNVFQDTDLIVKQWASGFWRGWESANYSGNEEGCLSNPDTVLEDSQRIRWSLAHVGRPRNLESTVKMVAVTAAAAAGRCIYQQEVRSSKAINFSLGCLFI